MLKKGMEMRERLDQTLLVAEQRRWRPGSNSAGSQKETDIAVCSQAMWSCPSPVYKNWAVAPDLLSCTHLSVSLTKRFTPTRSFRRLVLPAHWLLGSAIVSDYFPQNVRCALDMLLKATEIDGKQHKNFVFKALRLVFIFNLSAQSAYLKSKRLIMQPLNTEILKNKLNY